MEEKNNFSRNVVIGGFAMLIAILVFCWYTTRVRDNGVGANETRTNIESARGEQQSAIDRLETIESGLDDSIKSAGAISDGLANTTKTVDDTQNRIEASKGRLTESSRLIDEGKSILAGIRKRHEEKD